ncbi:hypothetical protein A2634_02225 [Candidatus Amesbacteria bacterium RIFCSPHIGHO2_01_FULL_48_32]|uniref:Uncharacterized protein n=1 Tax=Candidatus Amesbacteria bacterium RIFCSPLOWO2_01_FULL_48_25 TaxID=1797259 RepID=A0A1F4ZDQ7_9BACT|nr:MAG: hypothetical protein A2634_02225 [Candidatus Amesbacteria bacterium RIFCSPHIGHO2_01_FULL_48_32]OGD04402.1 MAG: hypothetical protein A2989_05230 [Candidatus Amesbacteria bacterium RIFCSPLOWO2_01_FULL_48_25]HJZ06242.1 hypothetical protein [Patescibacteria group bacterium]
MHPLPIFLIIYSAMIANSFWEAYVEGRNAWDKGKLGWKLTFGRYSLPAYHFFLFVVMWPLILSLPLVIYGWNTRLFGILLSAYFSGMVIEDFGWWLVNPAVKLSEFGPKFITFFPWLTIGRVQIPLPYLLGLSAAFISWYFLWR